MKKVKITHVGLDVDGVLANFCKAACAKMGRPYPSEPFAVPDRWLDDKKGSLWKHCRGHDFWVNIEPFPWAKKIHKIVESSGVDWRFITKPSFDPGSYSGKYEFIKNNFKNGVSKLWCVNGSKAYACTGSHHLLIDDNKKNCDEWEATGGTVYRWSEISENWPEEEVNKRLEELRALLDNKE